MSVRVMSWVWEHSRAKSPGDRLTLLAIADNAEDDGSNAFPGLKLLCVKTSLSRSQVLRCIERLVELAELEVAKAGGGRSHKTVYRVVMEGSQIATVSEREGSQDDTVSQPERVSSATRKGVIEGGPYKEKNRPLEPSLEDHAPPAAADAKKAEPPRPEVDELCRLLADRIVANGASEARYRDRPASKAWRDPMRRLIDLDKVSADRVRKAIDWCQADEFWKAVILSPANLRENYDKLRLAAQRPTNGNGHRTGNGHHPDAKRERQLAATKAKLAKTADNPWDRRLAELSAQQATARTTP